MAVDRGQKVSVSRPTPEGKKKRWFEPPGGGKLTFVFVKGKGVRVAAHLPIY